MRALQIILPIAVGAIIGYCTNYIAIKMLFRPRKELHIGKHRVPFTPGVIPKNKSRIASAVGNAVSEKLLTQDDIVRSINNIGIKEKAVNSIMSFVTDDSTSVKGIIEASGSDTERVAEKVSTLLSIKILDGIKNIDMKSVIAEVVANSFSNLLSNPLVSMLLGGNAVASVSEKLGNSVTEYIDSHGAEGIVPMVRAEIDKLFSASLKNNLADIDVGEAFVRSVVEKSIDSIVERCISKLIAELDVKKIVEDKINAMDARELEDIVLSVMKNELRAVVNLGALIGAIIGVINVFI